MPSEFICKKGLISIGNAQVTGSVTITGGDGFPLQVLGTGQINLSGSSPRITAANNSSSLKITGGGPGIFTGAKMELYGEGVAPALVGTSRLDGGVYFATKVSGSFIVQNSPVLASSSGNNMMVVTHQGKMSVGMTAPPTASLDVNGDIRASTNITASNISSSGQIQAVGFTGSLLGTSSFATTSSYSTLVSSSINVKQYGAVGDGVADDTNAFQSAFDNSQTIYVPSGSYIVGNLLPRIRQYIFGEGKNSFLTFLTGSTGYMFECTTGSVQFHNIELYGGSETIRPSSSGSRSCIHISASVAGIRLNNLIIHGFDNLGITMQGNSSDRSDQPVISSCAVYRCFKGIETSTTSSVGGEYSKITSTALYQNNVGIDIGSGNTIVNGCAIHDNTDNVWLTNTGDNEGHGTMVGCTVNHAINYAVKVQSIRYGFTFVGNQIFFGNLFISASHGINFTGNTLALQWITASANTGLSKISDNYFYISTSSSASFFRGANDKLYLIDNWRSDTDVITSSVNDGYTGSFFGTSSWSNNAVTSSNAISASNSFTASNAINAFIQDGNSFGQSGSVGTNDQFPLVLKVAGNESVFVSSSLSASILGVNVSINTPVGAGGFPLQVGGTGQINLSGSSPRITAANNSSSLKISGGGGGILTGGRIELYGEGVAASAINGTRLDGGAYVATKVSGSFIVQNLPTLASGAGATNMMVVTHQGKMSVGLSTPPTASVDVSGDLRVSTDITASNISASGQIQAVGFTGSLSGSYVFGATVESIFLTASSGAAIGGFDTNIITASTVQIGYGIKRSNNASNVVQIGFQAGQNTTSASNAVQIGTQAGQNCTTASNSVQIGYQVGRNTKNATQATQVGFGAGFNATNASASVQVGFEAGFNSTTAADAVQVGFQAGLNSTEASGSVQVGSNAGHNAASGSFTTLIGGLADTVNSVLNISKSIAIGYNAKVSGSNMCVIGGTGVDAVNVGIGTNSPTKALHVFGTISASRIDAPQTLIIPTGLTTATATVATGSMFLSSSNALFVYNGTAWVSIALS